MACVSVLIFLRELKGRVYTTVFPVTKLSTAHDTMNQNKQGLHATRATTKPSPPQHMEVEGGLTSVAHLEGLEPGRQYTVGVQASSPHGRSHFVSHAVLTWPGELNLVLCAELRRHVCC